MGKIADPFNFRESMIENYEEKLRDILKVCPFDKKRVYPRAENNVLPRTVYCNSNEPGFTCPHMSQAQIAVQVSAGKLRYFYKCGSLTNRLVALNTEDRRPH